MNTNLLQPYSSDRVQQLPERSFHAQYPHINAPTSNSSMALASHILLQKGCSAIPEAASAACFSGENSGSASGCSEELLETPHIKNRSFFQAGRSSSRNSRKVRIIFGQRDILINSIFGAINVVFFLRVFLVNSTCLTKLKALMVLKF